MLTLRDIMTSDVVYTAPDTPISEVVAILRTEGITGVPVLLRNRVVGVISASDILEFTQSDPDSLEQPAPDSWDETEEAGGSGIELESGFSWPDEEEEYTEEFDELEEDVELASTYTAADIMTRNLCALPPDTPIRTAAQRMVRLGVHRLLVMEGGKLVGIVTSMDFLRAVADGRLGAADLNAANSHNASAAPPAAGRHRPPRG